MDYEKVDKQSVGFAFDNASALLDHETERIRSLSDKAAQLAGFGGIILAILGGLASDAFGEDLGGVGEVGFAVLFFCASLLLAGAIAWLILFVYKPRRWIAIDAVEIENYLTDDRLLQAEPWALQIRSLRTMARTAQWAQEGAAQMAQRIKVGAYLFLAGLGSALGAVLTLGIARL